MGAYLHGGLGLSALLEGQTRIIGPEDQDTLRTRQFLAYATGGAGDPQEGAAQLRKLLAEQTPIIGPDHDDTLRTRQFLAVNLGEAGYRDEAVAILRLLLPDRRRVLGNDDPHTLRTAHMLARNLAVTAEANEAVALLKEVVAARERILGPDHPHTTLPAMLPLCLNMTLRTAMYERFTDNAKRVVVLGQEAARMHCHDQIGTEHILLGLISVGQGVGVEPSNRWG
jgi:hypothetical protein